MKCLSESNSYYMDGTFKYAPKFFLQLFTIHCERNGHYIPLVFCLLPDKKETTYKQALKHVADLSEQFELKLNPQKVILDFEVAIHKAVTATWPTAAIVGCRFHLAQSWYRKITKLGLTTMYRGSDDAAKWLQHLFGLPYVHPDKVGQCFAEDFMADLPKGEQYVKLADYLVDTYISEDSSFPPSLWASNTSDLSLTTNPCESFHSHFSQSFYHTHPNINIFLKVLLLFQTSVYVKINSVNTRILVKTRRVKLAEEMLEDKIRALRSDQITNYEFVKFASHRYTNSVHK